MKEKIRQIKYSRLHPNDRYLMELFEGTVVFKHKQYPKSSFYIKDDIIMFEIDDRYVMINSVILWKQIASNLILPVKSSKEIDKVLLEFFSKYFDTINYSLFTRGYHYKSWKHVRRMLDSIKRKDEYIK